MRDHLILFIFAVTLVSRPTKGPQMAYSCRSGILEGSRDVDSPTAELRERGNHSRICKLQE